MRVDKHSPIVSGLDRQTPKRSLVTVAGCGSAAPATEEPRAAHPVTTAVNTPSAATSATANRHRRVLPAPRYVTVARLYPAILGPDL